MLCFVLAAVIPYGIRYVAAAGSIVKGHDQGQLRRVYTCHIDHTIDEFTDVTCPQSPCRIPDRSRTPFQDQAKVQIDSLLPW